MTDLYPIASVGRLKLWWDRPAAAVGVGIWTGGTLADRTQWPDEPTAGDLAELADRWARDFGPLDADEWRFLVEQAAAVEAHNEYAESDIQRHGGPGATY